MFSRSRSPRLPIRRPRRINFATSNPKTILHEDFLLFLIILVGYTVVNIFADRLLAIFNNISVGWHVLGVLVIIALVIFVPSHHQSASFVFGQRFATGKTLRRYSHRNHIMAAERRRPYTRSN